MTSHIKKPEEEKEPDNDEELAEDEEDNQKKQLDESPVQVNQKIANARRATNQSSQGTRGQPGNSLSCLSHHRDDFKEKPLARGTSLPREAPHFAFLQSQDIGGQGNRVRGAMNQRLKGQLLASHISAV